MEGRKESHVFFFRQDYSAQTLEWRAPAFVFPVHCRILVVKTSGFAASKQKSKAEKLACVDLKAHSSAPTGYAAEVESAPCILL